MLSKTYFSALFVEYPAKTIVSDIKDTITSSLIYTVTEAIHL